MVKKIIVGSVRIENGLYLRLLHLVNNSGGKIRSVQHAIEICTDEGITKIKELYVK